jgi:branched-chain amino acid aminotransferase
MGRMTTIALPRDQRWVYVDGGFHRYADVRIGLATHALHYGTGCFEGIRAYWSEESEHLLVFRMPEHYERLRQSARILLMELPLSTAALCSLTTEVLRRTGDRQDVYIRPLVYKSSERLGVRLHDLEDGFLVCTVPSAPRVAGERGIRCMVSSWRRIDDTAAPPRTKCTGIYVTSALAKTEAVQNGFDEAILLTQDGHVCEGSTSNVFLVRQGVLVTPPVTDNILEGITRATIRRLAADELGVAVEERPVDRSELYVADEVFLSGTGAEVVPVLEVDRRPVGSGGAGPLTLRLRSVYLDICRGRHPAYAGWLTAVPPAAGPPAPEADPPAGG